MHVDHIVGIKKNFIDLAAKNCRHEQEWSSLIPVYKALIIVIKEDDIKASFVFHLVRILRFSAKTI